MTISEDQKLDYKEGVEIPFEIYQSTTIYAGCDVCVNAAGYLVMGDDIAGQIYTGVSRENKDNSGGSDGDLSCRVRRRGLVKRELATAITIANVGDNVFLAGDNKVDIAANVNNNIFCGIIAGYIDTTHAWIDIEPAIKQADVATHIADASEAHAASAISIADAGAFTDQTEVEAALQEIYQHLLSTQKFIPIPLTIWMIGDASNTVSFGGPATDPILDMTNGDTDSALRWLWAAASVEEIIVQIPLPPDIDVTKDLVLHMRTGKDANADTVTLASDAYFNEGDTKVEDVTATIAQAAGETTITIDADDIPAGAQSLTIELTPSAHAGDALYLFATWLEYSPALLAA